jgi:carboxyl-terminal processing protease
MSENFNSSNNLELDFHVKRLLPFLSCVALILGIFIGATFFWALSGFGSNDQSSDDSLLQSYNFYEPEYIQSIVNILNEKYLGDTSNLTSEEITYGMVKGLIESLGDKYTFFLDPEESEQYLSRSSGDFEGVGISLSFDGVYTYVESVLQGHPAEAAGVLPGDIILEVDGESVEDLLPGVVAQKIRGEKGSEVTLSIYRASELASEQVDSLDIKITRGTIEIDNIFWEKIDDNTVTIDIIQFSDSSAQVFIDSWDKVVSEIEEEVPNVSKIVVDLRGNPGGYVVGVKHILEEFLSSGTVIMQERTKNMEERVFRDSREGRFEDVELVVIVNDGSASASEIFASAIQDNDRGEIVGSSTVGKGVEQELIQLPDGSILLIVFQEWLTPNGRRITPESPITPDHEVDYSASDFRNNEDPQLDKALELVD